MRLFASGYFYLNWMPERNFIFLPTHFRYHWPHVKYQVWPGVLKGFFSYSTRVPGHTNWEDSQHPTNFPRKDNEKRSISRRNFYYVMVTCYGWIDLGPFVDSQQKVFAIHPWSEIVNYCLRLYQFKFTHWRRRRPWAVKNIELRILPLDYKEPFAMNPCIFVEKLYVV